MKISNKAIKSFNKKIEPNFNNEWNKSNSVSFSEYYIYKLAINHYFGMFEKSLSPKMIKEFIQDLGFLYEKDYNDYVERLHKKGLS